MSNDLKVKKPIFYGGIYMSLIPFLLFILGSSGLATFNTATVEGFWIVTVVGIIIDIWLYKDPVTYFDEIRRGTASNLLITAIFCWLWSAAVASILRTSGLVDELTWLRLNVHLIGEFFVGFTFILVSMYSTATGTDSGTVATMTVFLYPAGVALGISPFWIAAATISDGGFRDSLTPISDTTITAATAMGVGILGLAENRMPYTIVVGLITLAIVIGGEFLSSGVIRISEEAYQEVVAQASPEGLIMLIPAALIVFLAMKGKTLIETLTHGGIVAIILGPATGLFDWNLLVAVDTVNGAMGGAITDAISGWYGMIVLISLVFAPAHIMQVSGTLAVLLEKIERRFIRIEVGAETICWCCIAVSALGLCNNITSRVATGSIMLKITNKYHLSHYRITNFSDAVQIAFNYTMPWGGPALTFCVTSITVDSVYGWYPVVTSLVSLTLGGAYGAIIGLVYLICTITDVGREYGQKMKIRRLGYTEEYFMTQEQPVRP